MSQLSFTLDVRESAQRRIVLTLEVDRAVLRPTVDDDAAFDFYLPVWTPGSYLVREYARHLGPVAATDVATAAPLACAKVRKNRFRVRAPAAVGRIRLDYAVYAHELSVRTADATVDHAYWNHACVLLWPVDRPELPAAITVHKPADWQLATALPAEVVDATTTRLAVTDHDEAIDSPCLCGALQRLDFTVRGVPHSAVLDGLGPIAPPDRFVDDLKRIVEAAADVFGGPLPYAGYQFQCLFTDRGHGGLEHRASTTLLASRTAMAPGKAYQEFLGLCAHELFHVWNVKRMRPAELWSYDYENENYTPMLWLAEGWTAYYDDLLCRRAGLLGVDDYLAVVARNLTNLWSGPGRFQQSLAESSFDAWIRLYRPDEDTRNATQNYYGNGAVAALVLDLTIRRETAGAHSLDDVLRALYAQTYGQDRGYTREDVERCLAAATGRDLAPQLAELVDGALDPALEPLLADFGVELDRRERDRPYLGIAFEAGTTKVHSVTRGGPADAGGVAPGDELIAIEGLRVSDRDWAEILPAVGVVDRPLRLLLASRGLVVERTVTPAGAPVGAVTLRCAAAPSDAARALRRGWLGSDT